MINDDTYLLHILLKVHVGHGLHDSFKIDKMVCENLILKQLRQAPFTFTQANFLLHDLIFI